jgi:hypothetical protein
MSQLCLVAPLGILLGVIGLSGCDVGPPSGQERADAATQAACRQRADQAYEQQNRGKIYSPASQVNTPYSANYLPDDTNRGRSELFVHDRMVSDCVRNTGTGAGRAPPPPSSAY